jgi:hypothetical protein
MLSDSGTNIPLLRFALLILALSNGINSYGLEPIHKHGWKTFTDTVSGLTLKYPDNFRLFTGVSAISDTYQGEVGKGEKVLKVAPKRIDKKYHGFYEFNIWKSTGSKAECGPQQSDQEESVSSPYDAWPEMKMISGCRFYLYQESREGMSHPQVTVGYRGIVGDCCWQIQVMTLQATAYDDIKYFDPEIIQELFSRFLNSVEFSDPKE